MVSPFFTGKRASIESLASKINTKEDTVRLICKVKGQPPPKVTWFKDNKSINRDRLNYNFIHLK